MKVYIKLLKTDGRKGFKYFIGYKDAKKVGLYVYFSKKWVYIEETLMKLNIKMFW